MTRLLIFRVAGALLLWSLGPVVSAEERVPADWLSRYNVVYDTPGKDFHDAMPIGDGDIGAHFPPSDPRWRGAASSIFLAHAAERVRARGGIVAHLDATLICEAPKIGPFREAMRARIAKIAGVAIDRVGVKATTSEGLGFTGRREGIACLASATIRLPLG